MEKIGVNRWESGCGEEKTQAQRRDVGRGEKEYRLSDEQVQKAKMLGLNPKNFGKYAPNKSQPWKKPTGEFIDRIYARKYGAQKPKVPRKKARKKAKKKSPRAPRDKGSEET